MPARLLGSLVCSSVLLMQIACGGDGVSGRMPTATAQGATATGQSLPTETSNAPATAPDTPEQIAPPELPAGVPKHDEGTATFTLLPGAAYGIEAPALLKSANVPCVGVVVAFTWQAQALDSHEVDLLVTESRMMSTNKIGEGASGSAVTGCMRLEFINAGPVPFSVTFRYVAGGVEQ